MEPVDSVVVRQPNWRRSLSKFATSPGRATSGVWINYATTLAFQVTFAARLGTGRTAELYVVLFAALNSLGGICVSLGQTVVLPRLTIDTGVFSRAGVRMLMVTTGAGIATLLVITLFRMPASAILTQLVHVPRSTVADAIPACAGFVGLQVIGGALATVGLSRGARLLPMAAPACPSILATIWLLFETQPSAASVFAWSAVGSLIQCILLLQYLPRPSELATSQERVRHRLLSITAVQLGVLAIVPTAERLFAGARLGNGAAQFNYAQRSLVVVQQLLVGGVALAALGDWSASPADNATSAWRRAVRNQVLIVTLFVAATAILGTLFGPPLVHFVYGHGAFSPADERSVSRLLLLSLLGFACESVSLIQSQVLLASRRNRVAVALGFANGLLRLTAAATLGILFGPTGVALGYSIASLLTLFLQLFVISRQQLLEPHDHNLLRGTFLLMAGLILATTAFRLHSGIEAPLGLPALPTAAALLVVIFYWRRLNHREATP